MKRLLLLLMLSICIVSTATAQYHFEPNKNIYYHIKGETATPFGNSVVDYLLKLRAVGKKEDNYLLQATLLHINAHYDGRDGYNFNSANIGSVPANTTSCIGYLLLLKRPFDIKLKNGGREIAFPALDSVAQALVQQVALKDDIAKAMPENISAMIPMMLKRAFFIYPKEPLSKTSKWYNKDSSLLFKVDKTTADALIIRAEKGIRDSTSGKNKERYTINKSNGLLLSENASWTGKTQYINGDSINYKGNLQVKLLKAPPIDTTFDRARAYMEIYTSYWSDSLKTGPEYDSAKVHHFLALNDSKFADDSIYVINKLQMIQNLDEYPLYDSLLQATPNYIIRSSSTHLHNKLQDVYETNTDSALAVIQLLKKYKLFNDWVDQSLAQAFIPQKVLNKKLEQAINNKVFSKKGITRDSVYKMFSKSTAMSYKLLDKLLQQKDSVYHYELEPLHLWVSSQLTRDSADLTHIATKFEKLDRKYLWLGNSGRYGMLIYQQLKDAGLDNAADSLLSRTIDQLEADQQNDDVPDEWKKITGDRADVNKNLLANAYYLKYKNAKSDTAKSLAYLKKAAFYSPANIKEMAYPSFYDRAILHSQKSYRKAYAKALLQKGQKGASIKALLNDLAIDPTVLDNMRAEYDSLFNDNNFPLFFYQLVMDKWDKAPDFHLKTIDGKAVSLADYQGKWLLIDFWGTWCGPCREDMPNLQHFYDQLKKGMPANTAILTIAKYDNTESVKTFFHLHDYTLPVAMADDSITDDYKVTGYPFKVLISPEGDYFNIKFGSDWQSIAKKYISLYEDYKKIKAAPDNNQQASVIPNIED